MLRYTEDHEWINLDGDTGTVGISPHAIEQLGDIVFVELPEAGTTVIRGDSVAVFESVKAASDIYAPIGGTVCAVNEALTDAPETVNQDPYGDGWFFKLTPTDAGDLDDLLDAEAYAEVCDDED